LWSLTMYAAGYSLTAQPGQPVLDRRLHPRVVKDADGGRILYIQAAALGTDKESNSCRALPRAPGS
jgi:hypothetical protein